MIEINPGGVVKEVRDANYILLLVSRNGMENEKRTEETAARESRKYYNDPFPVSDVVQTIDLKVLSEPRK